MLALVLCALVWASTGSASAAEVSGVSAPLLAWSNSALLSSQGSVYESAKTEQSAGQLVLGALGKLASSLIDVQAGNAEKADLVVVYLGSQVDATALRQASQLQPLQQLSGLLGSAQSSLVLPFLKYQGASLVQELRLQLQASNVAFQVVGCSVQSEDLVADVRKAVTLDAGLQVLLVCPSTANARSHSPAALEAEVEQLHAVQAAVEEAGKHTVFVYANQPAAQRAVKRRLQSTGTDAGYSGFGPYTSCGPLCKTQVAWLQGMLALIFMAVALCSGMTCLYLLNGPSRFETVREGMAN